MKITKSLTLLFLFFACNNISPKDTTINSGINKADSGSEKASNNDPSSELLDYLKSYKNKVSFDTTIELTGNKLRLQVVHYCTFDSAIKVPEKYVDIYKINNFTTHDFNSSIKLFKNDTLTLDTIIRKNDFDKCLPGNLRSYGVLLFPNIRVDSGFLNVDYSISIPLTDVGIGVTLALKGSRYEAICR